MGILTGIGKDAGIEAAEEVHKTVSEAIPAADAAVKDVVDHATYAASGIVADVFNRLQGAELPIDLTITIRITGKLGGLKVTVPDYEVKP